MSFLAFLNAQAESSQNERARIAPSIIDFSRPDFLRKAAFPAGGFALGRCASVRVLGMAHSCAAQHAAAEAVDVDPACHEADIAVAE